MNPIDLSCKVSSTISNEVIPPQTTEVTDAQNCETLCLQAIIGLIG